MRTEATNRYFLGALIVSDPVLDVVRRELRRAFPDVRVEAEQLRAELLQEVLKREVSEGENADEARRRVAKSQGRALRAKGKAACAGNGAEVEVAPDSGTEASPAE